MEGHPILSPAYQLADGDKTFLAEIFDSMLSAIPENITEIEKSMANKQVEQVCRHAHHMKSSVMYTNAEELKELLSEIEGKRKDPEALVAIKALLPKVKELAEQVAAIINSEKSKFIAE
jgi:HPt (histidine-containing phosphotransfer) domain-containing protein